MDFENETIMQLNDSLIIYKRIIYNRSVISRDSLK